MKATDEIIDLEYVCPFCGVKLSVTPAEVYFVDDSGDKESAKAVNLYHPELACEQWRETIEL